jgi:hypothetical protein
MHMKIIFVFLFIYSSNAFSINVVETLQDDSTVTFVNSEDLPIEKIESVSASKRILIISKTDSTINKGDFISLVDLDRPTLISRALVAKVKNGHAGIKMLKIYSLDLWNRLAVNSRVKILKGDDSYFKKQALEKSDGDTNGVNSDLYDEARIIEDDLTLDDNKKRIIKTDNVVGVGYGRIQGQNSDGQSATYGQFNANWAFQFADNTWIEGVYGRNVINDFPAEGLDTVVNNIIFRLKYTVEAPFFSYIMPYIGYQILNAESPSAGEDDTGLTDPTILNNELELLEETEKSRVVFGATVLKRLVPGWFLKVDLGSDLLSLGFALEF